jgi:uncharacterized membrane protein
MRSSCVNEKGTAYSLIGLKTCARIVCTVFPILCNTLSVIFDSLCVAASLLALRPLDPLEFEAAVQRWKQETSSKMGIYDAVLVACLPRLGQGDVDPDPCARR